MLTFGQLLKFLLFRLSFPHFLVDCRSCFGRLAITFVKQNLYTFYIISINGSILIALYQMPRHILLV